MNNDFWILLGTISTTLTAFAFLGLAVFYKRARESFDDMMRHRFNEPILNHYIFKNRQ